MVRVGGVARGVRVVAVLLAASVVVALWCSSAFAGKGVVSVFGSAGSGDGQFANAAGTAVNLSSGDIYVVDQFDFRVERFDASGSFLGAFGWGVADGSAAAQTCTSSCQGGLQGSGDGQFDTAQGIAIDQSDGSVYVVDGNNNRVEKFDSAGNYVSQFGTAGSAEGQFSGPQGVAVDPTDGSVYVADANNNRVEKFDNTGTFVSMFGFGVADGNSAFETCTSSCQAGLAVGDDGGFNFPTRVAVDSTGRVYVLDLFNGRIERYSSAGAFDEVFDPTDVNPNTFAGEIAIGPGNDHLYVAQAAPDYSEQRVFEIDDTGTLIDQHAVGAQVFNASGLALNTGSQNIYLADGFAARVLILGDITAPDLTIDPADNVTATSASLSGSVTPNGDPAVGWHFEISTDDASWTPTGADQDAGNGNTPVSVSQNITGLVPNTHYFARLAATRPLNATTYSAEIQFDTPAIAPSVTTDVADDVTPDHAVLTGRVNPNNSPTTYYFEYGTTTAYGTSVPATQDADAGSTFAITAVLQRIDGLQPGTTYHYRLVATNAVDTVHGSDQTFTTGTPPVSIPRAGIPGTGFLPDNRGWEKMSPADKNNGDIMIDAGRTQMASDGGAARFSSLTAFGDAIGTSVATDYLSVRDPAQGWSTHAITPQQQPVSFTGAARGIGSVYVGSTSDLSKGVLLAWSPVTDDPNVAGLINLYLRDDARVAGAGSYQLLTACPLCTSTGTALPPLLGDVPGTNGGPRFAGASSDGGHIVFESQEPLTSDAAGDCSDLTNLTACPGKLYEWDHGTVRLVGILPDNACGSPPCVSPEGSQAGQGAGAFQSRDGLTPHVISIDGSRIFFTVPDSPGSLNGVLYLRVDHTTTVQLNASERTDCADHDPCSGTPEPESAQSATYWDASSDGLRAFFTTTEALTDNAPVNGDNKLYMYDASKQESDPHNLTLISVDDQPGDPSHVVNVQGVSGDGHYVYFAAFGRLLAGQPQPANRFLYVWHDGAIREVAPMGSFADDREDTNTSSWPLVRTTARVTPDGLHLLFSYTDSSTGPTGYDQGNCHPGLGPACRELYLYSYTSQRLSCVSCNPSGAPATANALIGVRDAGASGTSPAQNHPLTDDGRRVFFSTAEALAPRDVNGKIDAYEYDARTGKVHLLSSGTDPSNSFFMDASPSGNDVVFLTRGQLTVRDTDNNYDAYDGRIDGGYPEPPRARPDCAGDTCQGPQSQAPGAPRLSSDLVSGASASSRVTSVRKAKPKKKRCRKGYVRKRVRGKTKCVKKRRTHRVRRAGSSRRAK